LSGEETLNGLCVVILGPSLQIALGAFFVWLSFQSDLRMGRRGSGGPATPIFRLILFALGMLVAVDSVIRLFSGHGIEIRL
jgi:hypothetical protein